MTSRRTAHAVLALAALLVVGGVAAFVSTPPVSFGWFAYSPLPSDAVTGVISGAVLLSREQVASALVAGLGLVVAAGLVGFTLGRRPVR